MQLPRRVPLEARVLLGLSGIAGLLLVFAGLADDVIEHEAISLDRTVLLAFRVQGHLAQPLGPAWLETVMKALTSLGSPTVVLIVSAVTVGYFLFASRPRTAAMVALWIAAGALLEHGTKLAFDRARPQVVPHLVQVSSLSFPSGHAMLSTVTYLTLGVVIAGQQRSFRMRAYVLGVGTGLALSIGISRIYLGVHWPSDVVGGWALGGVWVLLFWLLSRRYAAAPAPS